MCQAFSWTTFYTQTTQILGTSHRKRQGCILYCVSSRARTHQGCSLMHRHTHQAPVAPLQHCHQETGRKKLYCKGKKSHGLQSSGYRQVATNAWGLWWTAITGLAKTKTRRLWLPSLAWLPLNRESCKGQGHSTLPAEETVKRTWSVPDQVYSWVPGWAPLPCTYLCSTWWLCFLLWLHFHWYMEQGLWVYQIQSGSKDGQQNKHGHTCTQLVLVARQVNFRPTSLSVGCNFSTISQVEC